jgi:hypothetical protein
MPCFLKIELLWSKTLLVFSEIWSRYYASPLKRDTLKVWRKGSECKGLFFLVVTSANKARRWFSLSEQLLACSSKVITKESRPRFITRTPLCFAVESGARDKNLQLAQCTHFFIYVLWALFYLAARLWLKRERVIWGNPTHPLFCVRGRKGVEDTARRLCFALRRELAGSSLRLPLD